MRPAFVITAIVAVLLLAVGTLLTSQSDAPAATEHLLAWNSFDDGMNAARQQKKKVLIDVYTDWCGWCKKMDSDVYTDPAVAKTLEESFVLIKLNAESNKSLTYNGTRQSEAQFARNAGVTGYPSTLFFDSSGKPITLLPGFVTAPKFLPILRYIGENHYQTTSFQDFLAKSGPPATR